MKKWLWTVIGLVILFSIVLWSSNQPESHPSESIKIGFIGPLTGDVASWGENQKNGIELAREILNEGGGVRGGVVEVVYEDSQCDPKLAASAAKKLIEIDKVEVIIGDSCSSATLAVAPVAESAQVVLITAVAGSDKLSQAGDYVFRNFIANGKYAEFAAEFLKNKLNKNKVAVLYINNEYGVNHKDIFSNSFEGEIAFVQGYSEDQKDFRTLLTKVRDVEPEAVFLAGYYPDGAILIKQAKEMGLNTYFLGASDAYEDVNLISLAGKASEGFEFLSVPISSGPRGEEFVGLYEEKYGIKPPVYSDYAFDTFNVIVEAMKQYGINAEDVKEGLYKTKYNGASNLVQFDENGDLISPQIIVKTIKNGGFVEHE